MDPRARCRDRVTMEIGISFLPTEAIIESMCSKIKPIYTYNREHLDKETLKDILSLAMILPTAQHLRNQVVDRGAEGAS